MAKFSISSLFPFLARRVLGQTPVALEMPQPFGYKTGWLAIKSSDTDAVIRHLGLSKVRPAAWRDLYTLTRKRGSDGQSVFVCPPMNGWTLVVTGLETNADLPEFMALLTDLSRSFGEAQYFLSYRVVDSRIWLRATDGVFKRGFASASGTVCQNFGKVTPEELDLGFLDITGQSIDDLNTTLGDDPENRWCYGDESDPLLVAGKWSINPEEIGTSFGLEPSSGLAGLMRAL